MKRALRVGWLLVGDERVASSRIQGFCIHRQLLHLGIRSKILNAPTRFDTRLHWKGPRRWLEATLHRQDLLVFQKVESSRAVRFARLARRLGTRIVFLQADVRRSPLYGVADCVVVSSEELGRQLRSLCASPIRVIEDAIDLPRQTQSVPSTRHTGLRLLWIGGRMNFDSLSGLRAVLETPEFADLRLVTVSDHPDASVPWSHEAVMRELTGADIAVIPCLDTPAARAKSNNRLTMLMGTALPVIATPIPAYEAIVQPKLNGFLAQTLEEWAGALRALRDPALRQAVGQAARRTAWERFAPEVISAQWASLFADLIGGRAV